MSTEQVILIREPRYEAGVLSMDYSICGEEFRHTLTFPGQSEYDKEVVTRLSRWLAIIHSLGLFNLHYFQRLETEFSLTRNEVQFFEKLIFLGMAEFRVVNNVPLDTKTSLIPTTLDETPTAVSTAIADRKILLMNGGGKDGSVSAHLLEAAGLDFTWFQRGNSAAQDNVTKAWSRPVLTVKRRLDGKRRGRGLSGHRPLSSGLAVTAALAAYLNGYNTVITSNEASANEANYVENGVSVNHQYSKSLQFERDLMILFREFNIPVEYFSLLRPLHELQIAMFLGRLNLKQLQAITSCNHGTSHAIWCLACAKCAFVALITTAVDETLPKKIWGEYILNRPELLPHLRSLIDESIQKPFECVGTLEECRVAALLVLGHQDDRLSQAVKNLFINFVDDQRERSSADRFTAELSHDHDIPENFKTILEEMKSGISAFHV